MKPHIASFALCLAVSQTAFAEDAQNVTLAFVGDISLDGAPGASIAEGGDPFAAFAAEFARADATFGNLECAVATQGTPFDKIFTFRAHPRVLPTLARHFAAVSLANNHSGDFGKSALLETLAGLAGAGVGAFGAGRELSSAHRPFMFERRGIRIALLGYDEYHPRAFEAGFDTPGVAWSEDEQVVSDIRAARAAGAELVIPFMHWGWENERSPCPRQRELARVMIDAGADAVVGAHPHVTQGAEIYKGKPIVYSLGNFVFDALDGDATRTGWLLRLSVNRRGVAHFETVVARLDDRGTPTPDLNAESPCGDTSGIRLCRGARH